MSTTLTDRYPTRLLSPAPAMAREDPTAWGTAEDGPLSADRLDAFDRLGYHTEQSLLTRKEIEVLQGEAARLAADSALREDERT
ncbi:ectoine hydroxylase, partial [Streptomyces sp. NPDC091972]